MDELPLKATPTQEEWQNGTPIDEWRGESYVLYHALTVGHS